MRNKLVASGFTINREDCNVFKKAMEEFLKLELKVETKRRGAKKHGRLRIAKGK